MGHAPGVRGRSFRARVVVVGGGLVGCSIAIELSARGFRAAIVEATGMGTRASGAAAGMLSAGHTLDPDPEVVGFGLRSEEIVEGFARRMERLSGMSVGFRRDGMLIADLTPSTAERSPRLTDVYARCGIRAAVLDFHEAVKVHHGLSPAVPFWLWFPDEAQVDAQLLARSLNPALRSSGVELVNGRRVTRIIHTGGRLEGVRLEDGGKIRAEAIVLAPGAWIGAIAGLPRAIPVRPVKGQILRLVFPGRLCRPSVPIRSSRVCFTRPATGAVGSFSHRSRHTSWRTSWQKGYPPSRGRPSRSIALHRSPEVEGGLPKSGAVQANIAEADPPVGQLAVGHALRPILDGHLCHPRDGSHSVHSLKHRL